MTDQSLHLGACHIDLDTGRVGLHGGSGRLTTLERALLVYLYERSGEVVGKDALLTEVWGYGSGAQTRAVDATVNRLRAKIELDPSQPEHLLTVWGTGYRLVEGVKPTGDPPVTRREAASRTNLSARPSSFVGREEQLDAISSAFEGGGRLVGLIGSGGTGKTRLAERYGMLEMERYPGGVWFCDLVQASTPDGITGAVGAGLGASLTGDDPVRQLGAVIAGRGKVLVILDNFEQVAVFADQTLGVWMAAAPDAHFLVTSRAFLRIEGERVVEVGALTTTDAVALFMDRAESARPGFAVGDDHTIPEIVDRLEGLALAIELAAARVAALSPADVLERLSEKFRVLSDRRPLRDPRQATLRGAIDWSWDLLAPWEQAALAQCSVFRGGFVLRSMEEVVDLAPWPDAPWALDVIQSLVDQSLLRVVEPVPGEVRYTLYEMIREYAAEKLDHQLPVGVDPTATRTRHAAFYAQLGTESSLAALNTVDGVRTRRLVARELDNLVAAVDWAVRAELSIGAASCLAAVAVLDLRGPLDASIELVSRALGIPDLTMGERARLQATRATTWRLVGQCERAFYAFQLLYEEAVQAGDRRQEGHALGNLGLLHWDVGRMEEARECLDNALVVLREVEDPEARAAVLGNLGGLHREQGRSSLSQECYEAALVDYRLSGHCLGQATILGGLGLLRWDQGQSTGAQRCFEDALVFLRPGPYRAAAAKLLNNLAGLLQERGELQEAQRHYQDALAAFREVGNRRSAGIILGNLGQVHQHQGRSSEARACYEDALLIQREVGNRRSEGILLGGLGISHQAAGRLAEAHLCFDAALAIHQEVGNLRYEGFVRAHFGDLFLESERWEEARAQYEAAALLGQRGGWRVVEGTALGGLGQVYGALGDADTAHRLLDRAEVLLRGAEHRIAVGLLLCRRAHVEYQTGRSAAARSVLATAVALAQSIGAGRHSELGRAISGVEGSAVGAPGLRRG